MLPVIRLALIPIIISGPHGETSVRAIFDDISVVTQHRAGLALISDEEMFSVLGDLSLAMQECGADKRCMAERLTRIDAALGLVVVVNQISDPPLLSLLLLDRDKKELIGSAIGTVSPEEGSVSSALRTRAMKLFDSRGLTEVGRVLVEVSPPEAMVELGSVSLGSLTVPSRVFTVPPGRHTLRASLEGYVPQTREVDVRAGEDTQATIELESDAAIYESIWFWAVVGAVVAGTTATAIIVASDQPQCFCVPNGDGTGCEACTP